MSPQERLDFLARLYGRVEAFSHAAMLASGALTFASVFLICFDVLARKFFNFTTGGSDELSGYAFAISTAWSLAFATLQRANVRVDVLYLKLPVRFTAILDWLSTVALGVFMAYLTWFAFGVAQTSWEQQAASSTPLATPMWIPEGLWALGLIWMCWVLALMLVRASIALVTGDLPTVKAIAGLRSSQEEADEEAAAGEHVIRLEEAA